MKNAHNMLATLKPGQRLQTKAADGDPLLTAVAEHAAKFEKAAEASALEIKAVRKENTDLVHRLEGIETELADVKSRRGDPSAGRGNGQPSPASLFLKSNQLQAMRDGAPGTGRVMIKGGGVDLLTKGSIVNFGLGSAGDSPYSVQATRLFGLGNNPMRPLRLLDVLQKLAVTTGTVEYVQLNGYTNAAAVHAVEGVIKAQANVPTQVITAYVATLAHFVRASLQVIDDLESLGSQIEMLLSYGVHDKLEYQLVNGPGGAGQIKGLYTQATAFAPTATDPQDRIGEAVTSLLSIGWIPNAILLNPVDWGTILRKRGSTNDMYLLGSPRDPAPPTLWSVPVVLSASMPVGEALVMDTAQMSLLDRQEITMAASREEGTNFVTNQITLLAELRAGLAVYSPSAVVSLPLVHA